MKIISLSNISKSRRIGGWVNLLVFFANLKKMHLSGAFLVVLLAELFIAAYPKSIVVGNKGEFLRICLCSISKVD
jgi:hypothetical protein